MANELDDFEARNAAAAKAALDQSDNTNVNSDDDFEARNAAAAKAAISGESSPVATDSGTSEEPIKNWAETPDASTLSAGQIALNTAKNIIPSAGRAGVGLYHAVRHPVETGKTLWQLGVGLDSKLEGLAGVKQDPAQKERDEAVADALGNSYAEKYGSVNKALNTLQSDPINSVLLDLSSVTPFAEASLGRVPGVVGTVGRAIGTAGEAINPFNPGGVLTGGLSKTAKPTSGLLDNTGKWTSDADAQIHAASLGSLSASDFMHSADPSVQAAAHDIFSKKGITPATVNEAVLRSQGLEAPASMVTNTAPPADVANEVQAAKINNYSKIGDTASTIAGASAPIEGGLGEALEKGQLAAKNNYNGLYQKVADNAGTFHPSVLNDVLPNVQQELASYKLPSTLSMMENAPSMVQSNEAMQYLANNVLKQKLPLGSNLTMPNLEAVRKELNGFLSDARGSDIQGMRAIIDGYDKTIMNNAKSGMFSPADSSISKLDAGNQIVSDMNNARSAFKQYQNTYNNAANPNSTAIKNATKQLTNQQSLDEAGNASSAGTQAHMVAEKDLKNKLLNPVFGPDMYDKLVEAAGGKGSAGEQAVKNNFKQAFLENNNGRFALKPSHMEDLLYSPSGVIKTRGVFNPDELAEVRRLHESRKILEAKPNTLQKANSALGSHLGKLAARTAMTGIGLHLHNIPGALIGGGLEQLGEHIFAGRALKKEMAGAPKPQTSLLGKAAKVATFPVRAPIKLAKGIATRPRVSNALINAEQQQRQGHAAGGKVGFDHEAKADKLILLADKIKKDEAKKTSSILNVDDSTVARALAVVNRKI